MALRIRRRPNALEAAAARPARAVRARRAHRQGDVLETDCERRPDGHYGLSKSFGEDVARFYFDRYGIESACLRIGSATA